MKPLLSVDGLQLREDGLGLSMDLYAGDRYAVLGMAASGKSLLLDMLEGIERPKGGKVKPGGKCVAATSGAYGRRTTPATIARDLAKRGDTQRQVQVLTLLSLWDVRDRPFPQLTPGQMVACDLLPCLMQDPEVMLIDGHLDVIDPWTLDGVFELLDDPERKPFALVASTCQPSLAKRLGSLMLLREREVKWAGTVQELIESVRPSELIVETSDRSTVRSMAEPLTVSIKNSPDGLTMTSHEGHALAARLLTQGYGTVKSVILREPSLEEALLAIH